MKKLSYNTLVTIGFCLFIGGFFIFNILAPDREFSENENRYLQQIPEFSFKSLFDGSYSKKIDTYVTDQFVMRDRFVEIKAMSERLSGKKESSGIYISPNDMLLERFEIKDTSRIDKNINAVESFANKLDIPVYLSLIPRSEERRVGKEC